MHAKHGSHPLGFAEDREVTPVTPVPTQSVGGWGGLCDLVIFPLFLKSKKKSVKHKNIWFCVLCFSKLSIRLSVLVRRPHHVWGMPHGRRAASGQRPQPPLSTWTHPESPQCSSAEPGSRLQVGRALEPGRSATANLEGQSIRGRPGRSGIARLGLQDRPESGREPFIRNLKLGTPSRPLVPVTFVSEKN